ncbi:MAG: DNA-processing protein DprA [Sandaracinaceae bacterium]
MTTPPIVVLAPGDPGYPAPLSDLPRRPGRIWVRGTPSDPTRPSVAVVGTRRADREAVRFAEGLAHRLAEAGWTIVSGGAEGSDAAAHRGAIAAEAPTVVVQAAPLTAPYPRRHRALFARVLETGGSWLSETPPDEAAHRGRFVARNRLIAALGDACVIVQAPPGSGALSTARWAQRLGRPLLIVPSAPWDGRNAGALALLAEGAGPCLDADSVAAALGRTLLPLPDPSGPDDPRLDGDAAVLLEALAMRATHPDRLVEQTGLGARRVQVALVDLAVRGLARRDGAGWRRTGR